MNEYARELGKVLRSFDTGRMRKFVQKHKDMYSKEAMSCFENNNDSWLLGAMAKMVMNRTDMSATDRNIAMAILDAMGWDYETD